MGYFPRPILHILSPGLVLAGALGAGAAESSPAYLDQAALDRELRTLAEAHPDHARRSLLAESAQGQRIWLLELGRGEEAARKTRPALLLVAGIEGHDLTGSSSALHWARRLLEKRGEEESIQQLLETTTLYLIPRLNPDAASSFFAKPRRESATDLQPVDDDHDGFKDEDGPEDLNGDGFITSMRVEDPDGEYILDSTDPRVLIKADPLKGERGQWKLLSEGRDNDGDENWNEDGPGGVNFNRNFPYDYAFFAPDAGRHQVSQVETRALADFVVAHPHMGIIFTFGSADNLLKTPKGEPGGKRPPTAIQEKDLPYYRELGKSWREALGLDKELEGASEPGTFSDWMYFHRGRLSLAARPWSLDLQLARKPKEEPEKAEDKGKSEEAAPKEEGKGEDSKKKKEPDKRGEEERKHLQWAAEHAPDAFVEWQAWEHPDFPGQKVEIGGWKPFARTHPPEGLMADLVERQAGFLTELALKLPRIGVRKAEARHLGESVYDITLTVENTGYLPTSLAQGETTREVFPTRVTLDVPDAAVLSGTRRVMLGPIAGSGGAREVRWVCLLKDAAEVTVEIHAMLGGTVRHAIPLNPRP